MPSDDFEEVRQILESASDKYREKWTAWKCSYYSAVLTISGVFVAISPLLTTDSDVMRLVTQLLAAFAAISCALTIWNILVFIKLHDSLGFDKLPKNESEMEAYYENQVRILSQFTSKARERRLRDRLIVAMLMSCGACLGIALYLQNTNG